MEKLERIEQYLTGHLSGEALQAFEQEIKQDPALAAEVRTYQELIHGIEASGVHDFEQRLQGWETQALREEELAGARVIRPMWQRYLAVAAAVLALFTLLFLFLPEPKGSVDTEELFAQHFQPMEDYLTLKGESRPGDSAMALYQSGSYHEALPFFEQALSQDSLPSLLQLYAAISYEADGQAQKAIDLLTPLTESANSYSEPAEWYLVLATLRAGHPDKARKLLLSRVVANENHPYREDARQLLEDLGGK